MDLNNLQNYLLKTGLKVMIKKDITLKYNPNITGIDYLIETDDYLLCFKDEYKTSYIEYSKIASFIQSVKNLEILSKKVSIGIFIGKSSLTGRNKDALETNKNITYVQDINVLNNILYNNNIFLYDEDDTCIMLQN